MRWSHRTNTVSGHRRSLSSSAYPTQSQDTDDARTDKGQRTGAEEREDQVVSGYTVQKVEPARIEGPGKQSDEQGSEGGSQDALDEHGDGNRRGTLLRRDDIQYCCCQWANVQRIDEKRRDQDGTKEGQVVGVCDEQRGDVERCGEQDADHTDQNACSSIPTCKPVGEVATEYDADKGGGSQDETGERGRLSRRQAERVLLLQQDREVGLQGGGRKSGQHPDDSQAH